MKVGVLLNVVSDHKLSQRAIPRAHIHLGQIYEILMKMLDYTDKLDVQVISKKPVDGPPDPDTPAYWFYKCFDRVPNVNMLPLKKMEASDSFDVFMFFFQNGSGERRSFSSVMYNSKLNVYLESDGELFLDIKWNAFTPLLALTPTFAPLKNKTLVYTTLCNPKYRSFVEYSTKGTGGVEEHVHIEYLPYTPMPVLPKFYQTMKSKEVAHVRVVDEGCLVALAEALGSQPIKDQKSITRMVSTGISSLLGGMALARYLFPGTCCHTPPSALGFRLVSKTWEAYLTNCIYIFPVADYEFFKVWFPDWPKELTIPLWMDKQEIQDWIVDFKAFDKALSIDDRQRLVMMQAQHNLVKEGEYLDDLFRNTAERIVKCSGWGAVTGP